MKNYIILFLFAISVGLLLLMSCSGSSQKKDSSKKIKVDTTLTGCDAFLGKWKDEKNNWEISITKSDDTTYWARVPARTGVGFMDIGTVCKGDKLINGKDWVVVTYSKGKIKYNETEYEKIE